MKRVIVVEDDQAIADTLLYALRTEGYSPTWLSLGVA
jgi:two-component system catabolic regulation response regulator CreB